ncbi:phage tail tape measure protein [Streptomyces sp. UH6]|uniref:phage tail tape measure protein n=1 Tax=Streptomyces sp. UH6 TaxID=2748379 RepID=UPI0015D4EAD7|nr:phage tail tape measure protein [Streptomyces sp. UH6]NYV73179.1 phage tail tape measure protein [Streptomyces sp. UH6]
MADRTVTVRLRADISGYTRSMRTAAHNTGQLADAGAKVGTVLVAGFAVAAASAAKFDKAMSNVRAVTGATGAEMQKLRSAALEAGKTTSYTATQAANAQAELARAGIATADIIGGALKGSLALAASGQIDLTEAAIVSAQAMNTFELKGKDVSHIADVLSAGANKSATNVHDLGMALRQGGLLAAQTGLSLEDTVGTLSAFADRALIGSDAGTSLKVMLQRLVPQSKEAAAMMDSVGFSAYDAQGQFVGLTELAARMQSSFANLTPEARNAAFATIFGSDAVRSATILYELGAEGITRYTTAVNDQGAAQRMAKIQTDNLIGDLERLRGAIEVALIEGGSAANGALREMTQWITSVVNAYNSLPPGLQQAVVGFAGIGGAAALAGAAILILVPRIHQTTIALSAMGLTAARARAALMGLGRLGVVTATLGAFSWGVEAAFDAMDEAPPKVDKMANSLLKLAKTGKASGEAAKTLGKDLDGFGEAVARIAHPGALDRVGDVLYEMTHLGIGDDEELERAREKLTAVDDALKQLVSSGAPDEAAKAFDRLSQEAEKQGTSTEKLRTLLPGYEEALVSLDTQSVLSAEEQAELAKELGMTADQIQDTRTEAERLADTLMELNGVNIDAASREIAFRGSLRSLTEAIAENGRTLDISTEKGQQNKSAFLEAAEAAMAHAQAVAEQTGSQEQGQAVLERDIELLREQMKAAGFSKDATNALIDTYLQVPGEVTTDVQARTEAAREGLQAVLDKLAKTKGKSITVDALTAEAQAHLEELGIKVERLPDGTVKVHVPTGGPAAAVDAIQRKINSLRGKTVHNWVINHESGTARKPGSAGQQLKRAHGGLIPGYPGGGAIEGPGTGTSDSILAWVSNGEYVIRAAAVQKYGLGLFNALNAERFAGGGQIGRYAGGGYTYTAATAQISTSTVQSNYESDIQRLRDAWADLNDALKEQAKSSTRATRKAVADARAAVYEANAALGLKKGSKTSGFSLTGYAQNLDDAVKSSAKWEKNLSAIGKKAGYDVEQTLRGLGESGRSLVNALAKASSAQFKAIVADLKALAPTAAATLADYTKQLTAATSTSKTFQANLLKLAQSGYGDLAVQLAGQGDADAEAIAAAAVKSSSAAKKANDALKSNGKLLTQEQLLAVTTMLGVLSGKKGATVSDVIAAGVDWETLVAIAPQYAKQIKAIPGSSTFVRGMQDQGVRMALGGITDGPTHVLAGEAGVPEAWIPWNGSARSVALLQKTAAALGYAAVPIGQAARLYAAPAAPPGWSGGQVAHSTTYNVYPRQSVISAGDLQLITRQNEARQRVGRPR